MLNWYLPQAHPEQGSKASWFKAAQIPGVFEFEEWLIVGDETGT